LISDKNLSNQFLSPVPAAVPGYLKSKKMNTSNQTTSDPPWAPLTFIYRNKTKQIWGVAYKSTIFVEYLNGTYHNTYNFLFPRAKQQGLPVLYAVRHIVSFTPGALGPSFIAAIFSKLIIYFKPL
jgi:hypothetical protein